jgi:hypothetical protein
VLGHWLPRRRRRHRGRGVPFRPLRSTAALRARGLRRHPNGLRQRGDLLHLTLGLINPTLAPCYHGLRQYARPGQRAARGAQEYCGGGGVWDLAFSV